MMELEGKNVLVVGLGSSGFAASVFLAQKGAKVKVTEKSASGPAGEYAKKLGQYGIKAECGSHTRDFCAGADLVVVSPGVDLKGAEIASALPRGVPVIGELELAYRFCPAPVVAITGTNGKSTATELAGEIMMRSGRHTAICGNIGTPFVSMVEGMTGESVAVVEVSSFQLETIEYFKPKVAALLNVTEDHYERHRNLLEYKKEKFRIFMNQDESDWAIFHSDFKQDPLLAKVKSRKLFYGDNNDNIRVSGEWIVYDGGKGPVEMIKTQDLPIKGTHNIENVMCCILIAKIMGVSDEHLVQAIRNFKSLKHRFESVGIFNGVEYIDDSKATNIDATKRALESIGKKVVLIAGGRDKGGDYTSISRLVKEKVSVLVVIGEAREKIKKSYEKLVPIVEAASMKEAVRLASVKAGDGGTVLLSPMCSSFDMFRDYKERGDVFRKEALDLGSAR